MAGFSTADFIGADAYDYAQMGREVRTGHGFSTLQIMPRHIPYFHERGWLQSGTPRPNLYRYPLPVLANAISQIFITDVARAAVVQTGVWFLASVPVCFLLATRIARPSVAFLCAVAFVAEQAAWVASRNGQTESLATLLLLLAGYLAFSRRLSTWHALALGIVCGLAFLARTQLGYLLPLSLVLIVSTRSREQRVQRVVLVTLGSVLVVAPWLVRNFLLTGDAMFSFTTTRIVVLESRPVHSDLDMQLYAPVGIRAVFADYGPDVLRKIRSRVWPSVLNPIIWTSNVFYAVVLCAAAVVASVIRTTDESRTFKRFTWSTVTLVLANFVVVASAVAAKRYNEILCSWIMVSGICSLFRVFDVAPVGSIRRGAEVAAYGLVLAVAAMLCLARFTEHIQRPPPSTLERTTCERLAEMSGGRGTVASDVSAAIALYGKLLSIRLPAEPTQLLEIDEKFLPIDYVVLSSRVASGIVGRTSRRFETYGSYRRFTSTNTFLDRFEPGGTLPDGSVVYRRRHQ